MFIQYLVDDPRFFFAVLIVVVFSICLHELSHGIVAIALGDRTPIETGHMTLSPLVHMGPIAIVCLLLSGITWGAMPVDRTRLRGRYAESLVAAAGPACNVLLAIIGLVALGLWQRNDLRPAAEISDAVSNSRYLLLVLGIANINLGIFNLIPVPPLDGSRILGNLSNSYGRMMDRLAMSGGQIALFIIVFSVVGKFTSQAAMELSTRALHFVRGF